MQADEKRKKVQHMFSSIAYRYDLLNHLLSFNIDKLWRKKAAHQVRGKRILDLAAGTGDMAIEIARRDRNFHIIGLDISGEMLNVAQKKARDAQLENQIKFVQASMEHLPFRSSSFDSTVIAFGLRNAQDRVRTLFEMLRVLRKKGTATILEFSHPTIPMFRDVYFYYTQYILPLIGKAISRHKNAYLYLPTSIAAFPNQEYLKQTMKAVGFEDVYCKLLTFGIVALHTGKKIYGA
ncbi:MAG: bifunctional demethylmenaquinone methyltransferase/2-methoxy-6-polyprenyl-1,4-benzoquinol methylase UbiE [Campylobacterota bacterium]|nr:bifunctional demethylmenaquinone methyltransferase/2-methoxy-6-polyprenyl-1,4-benzoquinol methylase UbiE [Campylobacterota bacterium]